MKTNKSKTPWRSNEIIAEYYAERRCTDPLTVTDRPIQGLLFQAYYDGLYMAQNKKGYYKHLKFIKSQRAKELKKKLEEFEP